MEISRIEEIQEQRKNDAKKEIKSFDKTSKTISWLFAIFIILFAILFGLHRTYGLTLPIDNNVFGNFGDFIGGVAGTIFAGLGLFLMISTIKKQIESNVNTQNTNEKIIQESINTNQQAKAQTKNSELQLFDMQFNTFLKLYEDAVNSYSNKRGNVTGRKRIEQIVNNFCNTPFTDKRAYKRRQKAAIDKFDTFYANHEKEMSVHLRMLYQLVRFISTSEIIDEKNKVRYAKVVRGRLSDAELLLIRYNSNCVVGKKMQVFINEFNLLKHLPLMNLLEFRKWKDLLQYNKTLCNALNVLFLRLHKTISLLLSELSNEDKSITIEDYKRWTFLFSCNVKGDRLNFTIRYNTEERHGGRTITPTESALEQLGLVNVKMMFYDFLVETFLFSNFEVYNRDVNLQMRPLRSTNNEIRYIVRANYPLIISQRQMIRPNSQS